MHGVEISNDDKSACGVSRQPCRELISLSGSRSHQAEEVLSHMSEASADLIWFAWPTRVLRRFADASDHDALLRCSGATNETEESLRAGQTAAGS